MVLLGRCSIQRFIENLREEVKAKSSSPSPGDCVMINEKPLRFHPNFFLRKDYGTASGTEERGKGVYYLDIQLFCLYIQLTLIKMMIIK